MDRVSVIAELIYLYASLEVQDVGSQGLEVLVVGLRT